MPIGVSRESQDRSFADMVRVSKADLQIAGSFSLTQLAPVQRKQTVSARCRITMMSPDRSVPSRYQFRAPLGRKTRKQSSGEDNPFFLMTPFAACVLILMEQARQTRICLETVGL